MPYEDFKVKVASIICVLSAQDISSPSPLVSASLLTPISIGSISHLKIFLDQEAGCSIYGRQIFMPSKELPLPSLSQKDPSLTAYLRKLSPSAALESESFLI